MRIAAAVTLYNPTYEIIENLKNTVNLFDHVYIYDNSEKVGNYFETIKGFSNVTYIYHNENKGLPIAFNYILKEVYKTDVEYLCTLDQDSIISLKCVKRIMNYINNNDVSDVAIVAPLPTGIKVKSRANVEKMEWVICSGSFLNLKLIKNNNILYDEAYFVDRFDVDFCMQIRKKKLSIIRLNDIILNHRCGDEQGGHSELRNYYMFRNRFYYNKKYYSRIIACARTLLQNLRHMRWVIEKPSKIKERLRVLIVAYIDFRKNKMGKISSESMAKIEYKNMA